MPNSVHITLRDYKDGDIETIHDLLNNDEVSRYLSSRIPFPYSHHDAVWWVETGSKNEITRVIEFNGQLSGIIGVVRGTFENYRSGELGYWLGKPFWGKGLATQAVSEMTNRIFTDTDIVRLFAPIYDCNRASMRVAVKCGYRLEGVAEKAVYKDGRLYDEYIYAKLKDDIEARPLPPAKS